VAALATPVQRHGFIESEVIADDGRI